MASIPHEVATAQWLECLVHSSKGLMFWSHLGNFFFLRFSLGPVTSSDELKTHLGLEGLYTRDHFFGRVMGKNPKTRGSQKQRPIFRQW
jgi:hypothetical protein